MKRIFVSQKAIQEGLILLSGFFLGDIRVALRYCREDRLDFALVAEATRTTNVKACPYGSVKLARLSRPDQRVEYKKGTLPFILKVSDAFLDDVLFSWHDRFVKDDLLLSMHKHHWVKCRDAWHFELALQLQEFHHELMAQR